MPLPPHTYVLPLEGSPDATQANSEWPKLGCWDLPTDLAALAQALTGKVHPDAATARDHVRQTVLGPAGAACPPALRAELVRAGMLTEAEALELGARRP